MADLIETLRKLQTIDGELFRLRGEERRLPEELEAAAQALEEQKAKAEAVESRLKTVQLRHKEKEIELSSREANVKKLQAQLFQVKTNKEYSAIQHEIEQAKADASLLEEEIINLLEGIDQASKEHGAELGRVAERQQLLRREQERITQALEQLRRQAAELETRRREVLPFVEANALALYERVLASREGLAIVPLVGECCSGCHMAQTPQVINETCLKAHLVTCQNCNRILYIEQYPVSSAGQS
ncbi:MAG: hypothetical protein HYZ92_01695 [Candidatus Omnitrophica bacterium]|nr:hypothetical protein [Candidatus Omnitrophota bacterium]